MAEFKNMKFRVSNLEHSKQIQELLFELGYKWVTNENVVACTYEPFIYTFVSGYILDGRIELGFKWRSEHQECTLFDLQMMVDAKKLTDIYDAWIYSPPYKSIYETFKELLDTSILNKQKEEPMKLKNSVIRVTQEENQQEEKPVEFTHCLDSSLGSVKTKLKPSDYNKVVYLGECKSEGDMFAAYKCNDIVIYVGHLNSGKY